MRLSLLILAAISSLSLFAALPDKYDESKYYARFGREIADLEAKSKAKGVKGKRKHKMIQKAEQLKARCNEWITKDRDELVREKESLEKALAETENVPEWQQKRLDELSADIARLEAFAQGKDYAPDKKDAAGPASGDPLGDDGNAPAPAAKAPQGKAGKGKKK